MKIEKAPFNIDGILKVLPHRFPFLLIDRLVEIDPAPSTDSWVGRKGTAIKNVTVNEPFFQGHFPHLPIMPGVLIIEALAQAAGIVGHRPPDDQTEMDVFIASVDNARFRKPVTPGDQLRLCVEITKDRGSIIGFHCEAFVDSQLVCECDMLAKSIPKKKD